MTDRKGKRHFASRPADPEGWIRTGETQPNRQPIGPAFTARLTVDITPELRGRIKIAAFQRGVTMAAMLRELLSGAFPLAQGDPP